MEDLTPEISKDILNVIKFSYANHDQNQLRHQILDVLSKLFLADSLVYFQVDENFNITETILRNLYEDKSAEYSKHFCLMDPFKVVQKYRRRKKVIMLEELVDNRTFTSTEYYNDFYRPQKIHHKIVVNLGTRHRLYSTICMHRPASNENFSRKEINTLKAISPYLVHALEQNDLFNKVKQQNNLLHIVEDNWSVGVIILDESLKVLYANSKARESCQKMVEQPFSKTQNGTAPSVLLDLLKDCREIKEGMKKSRIDGFYLPRHRIIRGRKAEEFSVSIQVIVNAAGFEDRKLLMIAIEEKSAPLEGKKNGLHKSCQFTKREIEIAEHIFKGKTNAEIAHALFVSEITVKWHIRNIFRKTGVKNRSALINMMLNKELTDNRSPSFVERI